MRYTDGDRLARYVHYLRFAPTYDNRSDDPYTGGLTMKLAIAAIGIALVVASAANAQTNDHFSRQRREAVTRRQANVQHHRQQATGHWGGPTTTHRYYNPTRGHIQQHSIQYYPVSPFGGSPYGYGIPYGGYYSGYYGGYWPYGSPYYRAPNIYIHREVHLGR